MSFTKISISLKLSSDAVNVELVVPIILFAIEDILIMLDYHSMVHPWLVIHMI